MIFKEKVENGVAIFSMRGSLLSEPDALRFRERFHKLVDEGIRHVIIDLAEVTYINSVGLGALISALMTVRRAGGDILLAALDSSVGRVLTITRLSQVFEAFDSIDAAFLRFSKKRPVRKPAAKSKSARPGM